MGQLQMATIATIAIENEGREMSQKDIKARLVPIQQVRHHAPQNPGTRTS